MLTFNECVEICRQENLTCDEFDHVFASMWVIYDEGDAQYQWKILYDYLLRHHEKGAKSWQILPYLNLKEVSELSYEFVEHFRTQRIISQFAPARNIFTRSSGYKEYMIKIEEDGTLYIRSNESQIKWTKMGRMSKEDWITFLYYFYNADLVLMMDMFRCGKAGMPPLTPVALKQLSEFISMPERLSA